MNEETPPADISKVGLIKTPEEGPAQIAIRLAQWASRKKNPVTDCLILMEMADGSYLYMNSDMEIAEVCALAIYAHSVAVEQLTGEDEG